ncbi:cysteine desulfurase family protein [Sinorhizobium sp. BG8]|uniref:cysteine desulfurase family protein n=1 Tax=Sinorhizobium sp. BG8 TaxID=2613773 RepID=UPI00193D1142|nr:cysteine desulfurase family protein [Sinorhizobium sp. BG8]QRM55608.1 cysteine desulfurase [Sinorhizobium sp. BG8]
MSRKARTYLDWNATAPILPVAREAILAALDLVGNPSSVHGEGRAARTIIEAARRDVAALVQAEPANVVFTSGATEAANLVLTPDFRMGRTPLKMSLLYVSAIEHPAVREGGRFAKGDVSEIPVTSDGVLDVAALSRALEVHDRETGLPLVAVMLANNETGIVQPVRDVAELVHRHGGLLLVDAVQAAGRMKLSIAELGADFLILSAHKLGGPKGAGALVSRGEVLMPAPLIRGGGQEKGHRSGTENLPAIAGFGAAAKFACADIEMRSERLETLRARMEERMVELAPGMTIHGRAQERLANTCFFSLPGLKSETGQIAFDLEGVAISAGSACSSGKVGESHVLTAMGFDAGLGGLRVSLGTDTAEADIDHFLSAFERVVSRRRQGVAAA